jgi:hypothetical protein
VGASLPSPCRHRDLRRRAHLHRERWTKGERVERERVEEDESRRRLLLREKRERLREREVKGKP